MKEILMYEGQIILSIFIAVILGFIIGFERKTRAKEAGVRTHTIVCAGAALIMAISKYGFQDSPDFDASRIASQIVSGISFLGAGIIIYRKSEIKGLTTAAGIWATAGVGMACGARLYVVAIGATLILVLVQLLMHLKWKIFKTKHLFSVKVLFEFVEGAEDKIKKAFKVDSLKSETIKNEDDKSYCEVIVELEDELTVTNLNDILKENPFIVSVKNSKEY